MLIISFRHFHLPGIESILEDMATLSQFHSFWWWWLTLEQTSWSLGLLPNIPGRKFISRVWRHRQLRLQNGRYHQGWQVGRGTLAGCMGQCWDVKFWVLGFKLRPLCAQNQISWALCWLYGSLHLLLSHFLSLSFGSIDSLVTAHPLSSP